MFLLMVINFVIFKIKKLLIMSDIPLKQPSKFMEFRLISIKLIIAILLIINVWKIWKTLLYSVWIKKKIRTNWEIVKKKSKIELKNLIRSIFLRLDCFRTILLKIYSEMKFNSRVIQIYVFLFKRILISSLIMRITRFYCWCYN